MDVLPGVVYVCWVDVGIVGRVGAVPDDLAQGALGLYAHEEFHWCLVSPA